MSLPPIAILAGGLATRLQPIAAAVPKSMVIVSGKPFIAHQLRLLRRQGFRRVVLLIGHLGDQIEDYVGDGSRFGLTVDYARDGEVRRGTGGALRNALALLEPTFFTIYGDSYLPIDVDPAWEAYQASSCPALMIVLRNRDWWDKSNVLFDRHLILDHDKSLVGRPGVEWIDYGMSIFAAHLIRDCSYPDPFDLSNLTRDLARRELLAGFEVHDRFYEIGKPEGLAQTEDFLAAGGAAHLE